MQRLWHPAQYDPRQPGDESHEHDGDAQDAEDGFVRDEHEATEERRQTVSGGGLLLDGEPHWIVRFFVHREGRVRARQQAAVGVRPRGPARVPGKVASGHVNDRAGRAPNAGHTPRSTDGHENRWR